MKDMKQHSDSMKGQLESSEAARKRLEAQMNGACDSGVDRRCAANSRHRCARLAIRFSHAYAAQACGRCWVHVRRIK